MVNGTWLWGRGRLLLHLWAPAPRCLVHGGLRQVPARMTENPAEGVTHYLQSDSERERWVGRNPADCVCACVPSAHTGVLEEAAGELDTPGVQVRGSVGAKPGAGPGEGGRGRGGARGLCSLPRPPSGGGVFLNEERGVAVSLRPRLHPQEQMADPEGVAPPLLCPCLGTGCGPWDRTGVCLSTSFPGRPDSTPLPARLPSTAELPHKKHFPSPRGFPGLSEAPCALHRFESGGRGGCGEDAGSPPSPAAT